MNPKEELEKLFPGNGLARADELRVKSVGLHTREAIDPQEPIDYPITPANKLHNDILQQYRFREKYRKTSYLNYNWPDSVPSNLSFEAKWNIFEEKLSKDPILPVLNTFGFILPTGGNFLRQKGWKQGRSEDPKEFYYYCISPKLPNLFLVRVLSPYGNYDLLCQNIVYSPSDYQFRKYHHLKPGIKEKVLGQFIKQPEEASPKS